MTIPQNASSPRRALRIGTRGSPLALAQATNVRARLMARHPALAEPGALEIIIIRTTGDAIRDRPLSEVGGKGLFTKEIEEALAADAIDLAVHSMKDMATKPPEGLGIAAVLPREDPRDALIVDRARLRLPSDRPAEIADIPVGGVVGTAALRRQAQLLHLRPDLKIVLLRGNVGTRLEKLKAGEMDATILAMAGLNRLGLSHEATGVIPTDQMLPAVAQGIVCLQARESDSVTWELVAALDDRPTAIAATAERAMLAVLDGSCRTPIGGWARLNGESRLLLDGLVAAPDGTAMESEHLSGGPADALAMGEEVGRILLSRAGATLAALTDVRRG